MKVNRSLVETLGWIVIGLVIAFVIILVWHSRDVSRQLDIENQQDSHMINSQL